MSTVVSDTLRQVYAAQSNVRAALRRSTNEIFELRAELAKVTAERDRYKQIAEMNLETIRSMQEARS